MPPADIEFPKFAVRRAVLVVGLTGPSVHAAPGKKKQKGEEAIVVWKHTKHSVEALNYESSPAQSWCGRHWRLWTMLCRPEIDSRAV